MNHPDTKVNANDTSLPYYTLENALKQILPNETKQWGDDINNAQLSEKAKDAILSLRKEGFIARPLVTEVGDYRLGFCRCDISYGYQNRKKPKLAVLVSKDMSKNIIFHYANFLGEYDNNNPSANRFPIEKWPFHFWILKEESQITEGYGVEVNRLKYNLWRDIYYSIRLSKEQKADWESYLLFGYGTSFFRNDKEILKNLLTAIADTPKNCEILGSLHFDDKKNKKRWYLEIDNDAIFFKNLLLKSSASTGDQVPYWDSTLYPINYKGDEKENFKRDLPDNSIQWESDCQSGENIIITSYLARKHSAEKISINSSVINKRFNK